MHRIDPQQLPIDLQALTAFTLQGTFVQSLVESATNNFFAVSENGRVGLRTGTEGCWDLLSEEWRTYFDGVQRGSSRIDLLRDLANGVERDDFPSSLRDYLHACRTLSLDRTCSPVPILSYPPSRDRPLAPHPPSPTVLAPPPKKPGKGKGHNTSRAGQSPKKMHEVEQFGSLVKELLDRPAPPTHVVDVGSGRAHLSRALAAPPLNLHVLAVDWSASQTSGAEYLDQLKPRLGKVAAATLEATSPEPQQLGSLTHRTNSLDADAIEQVLHTWPSPEEEGSTTPAMLIALHACGDLTVDAIKAFLRHEQSTTPPSPSSPSPGRTAILCGCCYNLMTPSIYPLSSLLSSSPSLTRLHLRLTPQSPQTWHLTPSHTTALRKSIIKIAFRARFEAELALLPPLAPLEEGEEERRVGRIPDCSSYDSYRVKALVKYGFDPSSLSSLSNALFGREGYDEEEEWEEALWKLQVFWTVRSWLGPPLESLLVVDRWAFMVEGMGREWERVDEEQREGEGRRRVEVVNLFEQVTGSLRNLAIVVR